MNKKLMIGLGCLCVIGSIFVACGSGDVSAPTDQDEADAQLGGNHL
jgi:hypothetical protein